MSKQPKKIGIYCFTNDLRLSMNPSFIRANQDTDELICIYCINPQWFSENEFGLQAMGGKRLIFLLTALDDLNEQLQKKGQALRIYYQGLQTVVNSLVKKYSITQIFSARQFGFYETNVFNALQNQNSETEFVQICSNTLFNKDQLPFEIDDLPVSFSKFRKKLEKIDLNFSMPSLDEIRPSPEIDFEESVDIKVLRESLTLNKKIPALGGEKHAQEHLRAYFSDTKASLYKKTRNALEGWEESTKFSLWLAQGSISPLQIMTRLQQYEIEQVKNESTYWIYFELLWREYFQWYALKYGRNLFLHKGIKDQKPDDYFNIKVFSKWKKGETGIAIVDACMRELNATGYMSNRGRQLVASCFVNELNLDWRYGAAYFEQQLIDYDVGSNWGNWQYLAGVGVDPRGKRRFDLEKQTKIHDPNKKYINKWLSR